MVQKYVFQSAVTILLLFMAIQVSGAVTMPMHFTNDANAEEVLKSYPLGKLTKLMASSHHGKEDGVIVTPNGLQAWVYNVGSIRIPKEYALPNSNKKIMYEDKKVNTNHAYILVFDDDKVIDVIYIYNSKKLTALQMQFELTD